MADREFSHAEAFKVESVSVEDRSKPPLLRLPYDLRRVIYHFVIPLGHIYLFPHKPHGLKGGIPNTRAANANPTLRSVEFCKEGEHFFRPELLFKHATGLFQVSKLINYEATNVFYGENRFFVDLHNKLKSSLRLIPNPNRARIRHSLLYAYGKAKTYERFWSDIIPNLNTLELKFLFEESHEERPRLRRLLKCLSRLLPTEGCYVEVEYQGGHEIESAVEKYLERPFRIRKLEHHGFTYVKSGTSMVYRWTSWKDTQEAWNS